MQANEMVRTRLEIDWYRIGVAEDLSFLYLETKKNSVSLLFIVGFSSHWKSIRLKMILALCISIKANNGIIGGFLPKPHSLQVI
jgi:hypothetical protein